MICLRPAFVCLPLLWLFAHGSPAPAQAPAPIPAIPRSPLQRMTPTSPDQAVAASAGNPGASGSSRLERLKQLTYDRRPSAILKAWSTPAKPATEAGVEKPEDRPPRPSLPEPVEPAPGTPAAAGAAPAAETKALEAELSALQRNVTLAHWEEVKTYWSGLPKEEGKAGYAQMVKSLAAAPQANPENPGSRGGNNGTTEQHAFELDDLIGLIDACPHELDRPTTAQIAPLVRNALQAGMILESLLSRLEEEANRPKEEQVISRVDCARLLKAAGQTAELERFLPNAENAVGEKDAESLILLSQCESAKYARDGKPETLERAFNTVLLVQGIEGVKEEQKEESLQMAVSLSPKVREDLGLAWLERSLSGEPEFGMRILAATGGAAAGSMQKNMQDTTARLSDLRVQKSVVESLLSKSPERASEWGEMLRLLALAWLREAELSRSLDRTTSYGPRMSRDMYGNLFFVNADGSMMDLQQQQQREQIRAISSSQVLEVTPNDDWKGILDPAIRPRFDILAAQLYLKVSEEEQAFPYIERMAQSHPAQAKELVEEFLRVWTRNHDPNGNSVSRYTSPYMLMYGFDVRAAGIPLTRSKQERNLDQLAEWVAKIRALPIEDLDESLLAQAFTNCHSRAEVYRLDAISRVFGSVDGLSAKTLAQLLQQMRSNLASVWRVPAQQEQLKTQRKQKDIEAEVLRGYSAARELVDGGLRKHTDNWQLQLASAALRLDEAVYRQQVAPTSEFSELHRRAIEQFEKAAELYAAQVPTLKEAEQVSTPYEHWFYAGLGASDAAGLDHRSNIDPRQPERIRAAILALPGEAAEKHMARFANALFTRMSSVKPSNKFSYLKAGFEIVGDAKEAREAQKVYDYYRDLVTEIKLVTRIDGSARVGHGEPFGVFVDLLHTTEIERESGGFSKYLQNQNSMSYAYNYGRPLENYRDKFEEGVRTALAEHFDVLSVTFQEQNVHARAAAEYGWRVTPYAFLLLKPRGPEIDKLPSLKFDLDFLDTTGYVALPVNSPQIYLDAAPDAGDPRPCDKLQITESLDERQAAEGKLVLEIKALGRGIVPPLDTLLDVRASDFEVASKEDSGVMVSKFDPEASEPAILSERTLMITYTGRKDLAKLPTAFHFPEPKEAVAEITYLRYDDDNLRAVEPVVSLERKYGEVRPMWPWWVAGGVILVCGAALVIGALRRRSRETTDETLLLPETPTPFGVLALLRRVATEGRLDAASRADLAKSIESLERHYFAVGNGAAGEHPDLRKIAERWVGGLQTL